MDINMADQAAQWADVSDVNTLKTILAAQQAQLAQLQTQTPAQAAPAAAGKHSDRKRRAVKLPMMNAATSKTKMGPGWTRACRQMTKSMTPPMTATMRSPRRRRSRYTVLQQLAGSIETQNTKSISELRNLAGPSCPQRPAVGTVSAARSAQRRQKHSLSGKHLQGVASCLFDCNTGSFYWQQP
jgi:hypothetical protein